MLKKINNEIDGLTMIEIMVSFSIIAVAFLALMSSFPKALSITKSAENGTVAAYLAQQKIEDVASAGYDTITVGTVEPMHRLSATATDNLYNFERETVVELIDSDLAATTTDTGMKKISTTVYFLDAATKATKSYNLSIISSDK